MSSYHVRDTCRLCGGDRLAEVLKLEPTPIPDKYLPEDRAAESTELIPLDLFLCEDCGNLQNGTVVDPERIYSHYLSRPAAVNPVLSSGYQEYAQRLLDRYDIGENDLVVEMGSNDGAFLSFFKQRGSTVLGVDPAKNLAEAAVKSGIETLPTFFSSEIGLQIREDRGPAKAVIANFVYANIDNVIDVTEGVRDLLAPDGIFSFETNYRLDVFEKDLIETINHEHLTYYAIKSLKVFFDRLGMELIEVERVPSKGGSIRCVVQLTAGPHKVSQSVDELIELEDRQGVYSAAFYESCANHLDRVRDAARELLAEGGGPVAGYGTSIGATMLIYQLGLGASIDFLVDDDPYRQGLLSPGYHIPVKGPQALLKENASLALVLAPLYAQQIMEKNVAYRTQGGCFATIWPEVQRF